MADAGPSISALSAGPNNCALEEAITLEMDFTTPRELPAGSWRVRFVADTAGSCKVVELGSTDAQRYPEGPGKMRFHRDSLDVMHLQRAILCNVGLMTATLLDGDDEVLEVPMVVHVTPDSAGKLFRSIYNPLE
ncbi:hypothetical protein EMIHUDRAFT_450034 [Emiliania huxleyi CCMP1516]|uniref:Uncharacterized protein n=2 Tax=Emiliania huxleyi TaxID=2903 RepID=A0A0D3J319_EMIH1|nr:hypothetical protein EMIHUDRAFT_451359 [Emiliania huxleyi CCMP1516]XP_005781008.1 hypothetical protein EMIHUDRAFT_450034 [Emiliania huxleyi CCMP1516]EOD17904.1 hypothetical protein EMIHUDRAFT_451359 [Emiliania huxleyi CCMP1516]EOD28579.1 hypothetical protein EMIHUDRAFT_450034 [Emiliania huxleyi CCMP1516]|eukprot:XP_005770333.1 hypothetical protein EMIHUDRAFT_451359 [Emiliania huxleyi CCMP1516]